MIPIQFVYTENGQQKSSLDEHRRRCEIMEHNKRLHEEFLAKQKKEFEDNIDDFKERLRRYNTGQVVKQS